LGSEGAITEIARISEKYITKLLYWKSSDIATYVCVLVCIYVCMYVCMYVCIYDVRTSVEYSYDSSTNFDHYQIHGRVKNE